MAANSYDNDTHFDHVSSGAGASLTYTIQCSALRKNGYVVIKDRPCKILDISTVKAGHYKVHLVALDIFTGKKLEDLSPLTHNVSVPNVSCTEYTLVDIDDGFLNLLDADGAAKDDVKVPEGELGQKMRADFDDGNSSSQSLPPWVRRPPSPIKTTPSPIKSGVNSPTFHSSWKILQG